MGHYCKICGKEKSNESFSGRGHAQHICKKCAKLPKEKRDEILLISRIDSLPYRISQKQRMWLNTLLQDNREDIRRSAEFALNMRTRSLQKHRDPDEENFDEPPLYDDADFIWEPEMTESAEPSTTTDPLADLDITELPF